MASTDALLAKAAERIGQLTVSHDWLDLQLAETQQALEAVTLDRDQMHTQYHLLRVERDALALRLKEFDPPEEAHPTPKVKRTVGAGLK